MSQLRCVTKSWARVQLCVCIDSALVSWTASVDAHFFVLPVQLVAKVYNINPHPHWEIFLGLLCFLFALHLYWCDLRCSLPGHSLRYLIPACMILACHVCIAPY